jgi:hypothetical protein
MHFQIEKNERLARATAKKLSCWSLIALAMTFACNSNQSPSFQTSGENDYKLKVTEAASTNAEAGGDSAGDGNAEAVTNAEEAQEILDGLQTAMDDEEAASESGATEVDAENQSKGKSAAAGEKKIKSDEESGSEAEPNAKELAACSRLSGQGSDKIVIVNNKTMPEIAALSVLAIKLVGNKTELTLDLVGEEGLKLKSICVFAAGNQTHFKLSTSVSLDQFIFVGRGNLTKGTVEVAENASIGMIFGSLAGNQSTLSISGAGTFDCSNVVQKHANTTLNCK